MSDVLTALALVLALAVLVVGLGLRRITVFQFERGLHYRRGRFTRVLEPGTYWLYPRIATITKVDVRARYVSVPSQEISAADGVTVKVTVAARFAVTDPERAIHAVADYLGATYTHLQLALREIVSAESSEALMASRTDLGKRLTEAARGPLAGFGLNLEAADIKDVMLAADVKRSFAQVVKARQEGLAALERARGETAALRNLANAAAMVEQRPALLQLRWLQLLAQGGGNTVVLGVPGALPVPAGGARASDPQTEDDQTAG